MSASSATVTLNTGKIVPKATVAAVRKDLRAFFRQDTVIVAELVTLARNPEEDMFSYYLQSLRDLGLTQHTAMDEDLRVIVLASTRGEDWFDIELVDPSAPLVLSD